MAGAIVRSTVIAWFLFIKDRDKQVMEAKIKRIGKPKRCQRFYKNEKSTKAGQGAFEYFTVSVLN